MAFRKGISSHSPRPEASVSTRILVACVCVGGCVVNASSVSAGFINNGFESPVVNNSPLDFLSFVGGQSFDGWTVVGSDVLIVNTNRSELMNGVTAFNAHSGNQHLDLTGTGNTGITDGVQQAVQTAVGHTYELSFYVGRADGNSLYSTPSVADVSINGGFRISFTNANVTPSFVNWQGFTMAFTATTARTLIAFYNGTPAPSQFGGTNNYVGLDDVNIRELNVVPEPSSLLLGLSGFVGLPLLRRRATRLRQLKAELSDS